MPDPAPLAIGRASHNLEVLDQFIHQNTQEFGVDSIVVGCEYQWLFRIHA